MKPSYTEQRRNEPRTDRKLRAEDEHLVARDKQDVVSGNHGDRLEPLVDQFPASKAKRREKGRSKR